MADLKLLDAAPSDAEREAIDAVLGRAGRRTAAPRAPTGASATSSSPRCAPRSAASAGSARGRSATRHGVSRCRRPRRTASRRFYALLALEEHPADVTHVCTDLSCALKGATVGPGEHPSPCLGLCERAPAKYRTVAGEAPFEEQLPAESPPLPQRQACGCCAASPTGVDPTSLDAYVAAGGFEALAGRVSSGRTR